MTEINKPQQTPVGSFTNDQWLYTHRGPNKALRKASYFGVTDATYFGWMDHLDTNKIANGEWEYIAEPYADLSRVEQDNQAVFDFLRSVGWKIEFAGKEKSVWAHLYGNSTIHISIVKDWELAKKLELESTKRIEGLIEEKKLYPLSATGGRYLYREGVNRTLWDVIQDLDKERELRRLIKSK